jgi:hypothetical protein
MDPQAAKRNRGRSISFFISIHPVFFLAPAGAAVESIRALDVFLAVALAPFMPSALLITSVTLL